MMSREVHHLASDQFDFDAKKLISQGRQRKVFSVPWKGNLVAVKSLSNYKGIDNDEANLLTKIAHKNIVDFFGIVSFKDKVYIVIELASYGSLADILYEKPPRLTVTNKSRFEWTADMAQGLAYLHYDLERTISHGDMKSGNVLICSGSQRPVAKITDFGLGRQIDATVSVDAWGTLLWSAPEILKMKGRSVRSDVWSLAVTVVELYTGEMPYAHISDQAKDILPKVKKGQLTPLSQMSREQLSRFPPVLTTILADSFVMDHGKRMTMRQIVTCLAEAASGAQHAEEPSPAKPIEPARAQHAEEPSPAKPIEPAPRMAKFRVCFLDNDEKISIDLPGESVLGRELRAEVVKNCGQRSHCFELLQWRGRRSNDQVDAVFVGGGCYADKEGATVMSWELEAVAEYCICDDETVPLASDRRAVISVSQK